MKGIIAIIAVLALVGCGRKPGYEEPPVAPSMVSHASAAMLIYVDPETGCQYLTVSSGITPRLDPEGRPMCKKP